MTDTEKKHTLRKATTRRGKIELSKRLPKLIEDPKICCFINTSNSSEIMRMVLNDLYLIRKSFSLKLNKKNQINCPFENTDFIEKFNLKHNSALFSYTSDTKKRPMNLVFGNLFNHKVLDLFEFEITNFIPHEYFNKKMEFEPNRKPVLVFLGEQFETNKSFERFKFYLMDFFKQDEIEDVNITDLKRIIVFSITESEIIKIRNYQCASVSEYSLNNINLEETGPSFDLKSRRTAISPQETYLLACKQPKLLNKENKKKVNTLLDVKAKIFPAKQNLNAASLRRYDKILGRKRKINKEQPKKTE